MKKYLYTLLAILFIFISFYGYFVFGNQMRASRALSKGNDYTATMYSDYKVMGQSCQGEDTNRDSYVTCNFRLQNMNGVEKTITLQCPTFWKSFMSTSCKEQGIVINQQ